MLKITQEDFISWYNKQEQKCFYCKRTMDEVKKSRDSMNDKSHRLTIDRVDNNKGYEDGNMVLACMRCNSTKGDYFTKDEMLKIGKIIYDKNS